MNTKYTAKYGWQAAKNVLYGLVFFVTMLVMDYLYGEDVYYILDTFSTSDMSTWAQYSAIFSWISGGLYMLYGLMMDALCEIKAFMIRTTDKISKAFKKA